MCIILCNLVYLSDMRPYKQYTDQDIIKYSKEVKSLAALLKKVGLKPVGGNYANMKRNLQRLKVDTTHWTGQAWSKDAQLKDWTQYSKARFVKPHLIRERGHQCEACRNTQWNDKPIPLEIHHIDGCNTNNDLSNLSLLCPNCHAFTDTYRRPNWLDT